MKQIGVGWLLLLLWPACIWATPDGPKSMPTEVDSFQELDAEVEQVLGEVLSLGADMVILQAAREMSPRTQLLVLVSITPSAIFQLEAVQLLIDENTAMYHQYTRTELEAMAQGGSHRLFLDDVPAGRRQITAVMFGRVPKGPDYQRKASYTIVSGIGRRVLELNITAGKKQTFPELAIKEWK
jgi:hypothetical protein